jgi:predicted GNAT family N-acyltransferase
MEVRPAHGEGEVAAALELRHRVFHGEQGVPVRADRDGRDPEALHLVAVEDDRVVGTCRLVFDGPVAKLGRMAVEPELRGRGIGDAILAEAVRAAQAARAASIALHAQLAARGLYARHGFVESGPEFVEQGIPHVAMEKPLA